MYSCELQKCQWATPADPGISSQIVICLLFACDYLRYIVLQVCRTQRVENGIYLQYHINIGQQCKGLITVESGTR